MQHVPLTFTGATTLQLTASEQFSDQIGISELTQHDLRVIYDPDITNSAAVYLQTTMYVSSDGMNVEAGSSTWCPYTYDNDDGAGNLSPVQRKYQSPAISTSSALRNPNRSFPIGAKKIRFGFLEAGVPGDYGDIASGMLSSHA